MDAQPEVTLDPADFFVTYTGVDEEWAVWIAWCLELAGYKVIVQAWDFRAGHNFVLRMHEASSTAKQTIPILTPAYLEANYPKPEWAAAFVGDPTGKSRRLIPIRVKQCNPDGLLKGIVCLDLVDEVDEHAAILKLLNGIFQDRGKPTQKPPFPGNPSTDPKPVASSS